MLLLYLVYKIIYNIYINKHSNFRLIIIFVNRFNRFHRFNRIISFTFTYRSFYIILFLFDYLIIFITWKSQCIPIFKIKFR